ncbi:MAG: redoxin domain-containing protein [Aureliella sp.]
MKILTSLTLAALAGLASVPAANAKDASTKQDGRLTIGDAAPTLDIEHWVQDADGELKPVEKFEKGTVYIIEFWATWCGPCISSMPHLAETQQNFDYDKVRLVSVSTEDLDTVETFLDKTVRGEEERTYRELTSVYSLTTDPDRSVHTDYMTAAAQRGIPTAFIVGKTGVVEWIGHPMSMDKPLEEVLDDSWDREAFGEQFRKAQEAEFLMQEIAQKLRGSKEDCKEALALIDEAIEGLDDGSRAKRRLQDSRLQALAGAGMVKEAAKSIEDGIKDAADDVNSIMSKVMMVGLLPADSDLEVRQNLLAVATERVEGLLKSDAIKETDSMKSRIHLSMGQLYMRGELTEQAIVSLRTAKELSDDDQMSKYIESMLERLEPKDEEEETPEEETAEEDGEESDK